MHLNTCCLIEGVRNKPQSPTLNNTVVLPDLLHLKIGGLPTVADCARNITHSILSRFFFQVKMQRLVSRPDGGGTRQKWLDCLREMVKVSFCVSTITSVRSLRPAVGDRRSQDTKARMPQLLLLAGGTDHRWQNAGKFPHNLKLSSFSESNYDTILDHYLASPPPRPQLLI